MESTPRPLPPCPPPGRQITREVQQADVLIGQFLAAEADESLVDKVRQAIADNRQRAK